MIDHLDGTTDWPLGPDGAHPLTELLLDDYLVVDVSKPFAEDSCLEIERALLVGRPHETCGGRSLNNRTMHAIYTLLVNAGHGPRIGDGVDRRRLASDVFPYMAPPNPCRWAGCQSGISSRGYGSRPWRTLKRGSVVSTDKIEGSE